MPWVKADWDSVRKGSRVKWSTPSRQVTIVGKINAKENNWLGKTVTIRVELRNGLPFQSTVLLYDKNLKSLFWVHR